MFKNYDLTTILGGLLLFIIFYGMYIAIWTLTR